MKEYKISLQGKDFNVVVKDIGTHQATVEVNGKEYIVGIESKRPQSVEPLKIKPVRSESVAPVQTPPMKAATAGDGSVVSPLPGVIMSIKVNVGDKVKVGQTVMILEAMKMENEIRAPQDGKVTEILVKAGDSIIEGATLLKIGG